MTTALFVGRFQPFHYGHLKVIKDILKEHDRIVIIIGATQESNTFHNPFTAQERSAMIRVALEESEILNESYKILEVPDADDDVAWTVSIFEKTDADIAYSNNDWTKRCLEKQMPVQPTPQFYDDFSTLSSSKKVLTRFFITSDTRFFFDL